MGPSKTSLPFPAFDGELNWHAFWNQVFHIGMLRPIRAVGVSFGRSCLSTSLVFWYTYFT